MEELGLSDNPFEPRRMPGKPKYTAGLSRKELRLDLHEPLVKLYFERFPISEALEKRWTQHLRNRGYKPGQALPFSSSAVLIRGRKGTGKTTLAAKFLHYLKTCGKSAEDWRSVEFQFRDVDVGGSPLSPDEVRAGCAQLSTRLEGIGSETWVTVLVDNVSLDALGAVLDVYAKAVEDRYCVFVIVGDDVRLLDDALDGFPLDVDQNVYELEALDPEAAVAYAAFRIGHFRHPEHPANELSDALFPFLAESIRRWIGQKQTGQTSVRNPLVARVLNGTLRDYIDKLEERFSKDDIRALPPPRQVTREFLKGILDEL